jgi:hypothetical protein
MGAPTGGRWRLTGQSHNVTFPFVVIDNLRHSMLRMHLQSLAGFVFHAQASEGMATRNSAFRHPHSIFRHLRPSHQSQVAPVVSTVMAIIPLVTP